MIGYIDMTKYRFVFLDEGNNVFHIKSIFVLDIRYLHRVKLFLHVRSQAMYYIPTRDSRHRLAYETF